MFWIIFFSQGYKKNGHVWDRLWYLGKATVKKMGLQLLDQKIFVYLLVLLFCVYVGLFISIRLEFKMGNYVYYNINNLTGFLPPPIIAQRVEENSSKSMISAPEKSISFDFDEPIQIEKTLSVEKRSKFCQNASYNSENVLLCATNGWWEKQNNTDFEHHLISKFYYPEVSQV